MPKEPNPQPDYFALLKEAEQASEAADNFNVRFESASSREEYDRLVNASDEAQKALITYIHDNYDSLAASLNIKPIGEEDEEDDEKEQAEEEHSA